MNKILIVNSDPSEQRLMSGLLTRAGYGPNVAENMDVGKEAVRTLPSGALIIVDMKFHGGTAPELIDWLRTEDYSFPVLALVDNLNNADLLEVMRDGGAKDVIQRPAINKQLVEYVKRYMPLKTDAEDISFSLPTNCSIYESMREQISVISKMDSNCIIFGESGVGKEQVAREIVNLSARRSKPCTEVDADGAALVGMHDPTSERSESFNRLEGYFRKSSGGTLIVKNIQLLPPEKQSILLHILSEEHPDVRIICTASPTLIKMVEEEQFRSNLYFILRPTEIDIPPLRDVPEDIPVLANYFLNAVSDRTGGKRKRLDQSAIKALRQHPWPGNVRELNDAIQFAFQKSLGDTISSMDLALSITDPDVEDELMHRNPRIERENIIRAFRKTGSWKEAAQLLHISDRRLRDLRKNYGIEDDELK